MPNTGQRTTTAVTAPAAITAEDAPAGGTGAAAGGWDTAGNRDLGITTINALVDDVTALHATVDSMYTELVSAGIIS